MNSIRYSESREIQRLEENENNIKVEIQLAADMIKKTTETTMTTKKKEYENDSI